MLILNNQKLHISDLLYAQITIDISDLNLNFISNLHADFSSILLGITTYFLVTTNVSPPSQFILSVALPRIIEYKQAM